MIDPAQVVPPSAVPGGPVAGAAGPGGPAPLNVGPPPALPPPPMAQPAPGPPAGSPMPQAGPPPALPPSPASLGQTPPPLPPPPPPGRDFSAPNVTPSTSDEHLPRDPKPDDMSNLFERRGALLSEAAQDLGQRVAEMTNQTPLNAAKLDDGQKRDYWRFSPNGTNEQANNALFWQVHDQVLAQGGQPAQAEQQAMDQVFPYRAKMVGMGVAGPDKQVQTAEQLRKLVDGSLKPDSAPASSSLHAANERITGG